MNSLIVCADDYGQNEPISSGILKALTAQRINAISCMTNMPSWNEYSQYLKPFLTKNVGIGLHLNLTQGVALSSSWKETYGAQFNSLSSLMLKSYSRMLSYSVLYNEISSQVNQFREQLGIHPHFIDGHQHVHQLPTIRKALLDFIVKEQLNAWLRVSGHEQGTQRTTIHRLKVQIIAQLGARTLRQSILQHGLACNTSFSGIYQFKYASNYPTFFKQFLKESQPNGLIMCHPGLNSADKEDPISAARFYEFQYLMSDVFLSDMEEHQFNLDFGGFK